MAGLEPIDAAAIHVAIDVQRIFLEPGRWQAAHMPAILPNIATLARAKPGRSVFTRFVVPRRAADAPGRWRRYYEHWKEFTGEHMPGGMIDIVPTLAAEAERANVVDKPTYSAFEAESFVRLLASLRADTLVFSGVETDVCVLATLLGAIDRGFRVIAVADALASGSPAAHAAVLDILLPRLAQQVEVATTAEVIVAWSDR